MKKKNHGPRPKNSSITFGLSFLGFVFGSFIFGYQFLQSSFRQILTSEI
jgi:hypothetical protein